MWERFSYYGMRALLVLYLVNSLHWSAEDAANLYGTYTMLVYLTPVIGGFLADRLIGTRTSLVWGAAIIAAGAPSRSPSPGDAAFYAGLGLIIVGTGFFKSNVSTMVGQIYWTRRKARRDAGFTIYYMGINLGAFIGPIICGYLGQSPNWGWHYGFAAAGAGMLLGLIGYLLGRDKYLPGIGLPERTATPTGLGVPVSNPMHAVAGAVAGGLIGWFGGGASFSSVDTYLGLVMGAVIGAALAIAILGTEGEERKRVIAIFIVAFFVVFFWAAYEQAGSSMNLFADRNTDLTLGGLVSTPIPVELVSGGDLVLHPRVRATVRAGLRRSCERAAMETVDGAEDGDLAPRCSAWGSCSWWAAARRGPRAEGELVLARRRVLPPHDASELCVSPIGLSYAAEDLPAAASRR